MYVTIPCAPLRGVIDACKGVVDPKSLYDDHRRLLLRAEAGSLHVSAAGVGLLVTTSCPATVVEPGWFTVDARMLATRVAAMPVADLSLRTFDSTTQLVLTAAGYARKFMCPVAPTDHAFPTPEAFPAEVGSSFPARDLHAVLAATTSAASTDETRAHVNAVRLVLSKRVLRGVATDGHRLVVVDKLTDAGDLATLDTLVPLRAARVLQQATDVEGDVRILAGKKVLVEVAGVHYEFDRVEATFPPYMTVIPTNAVHRVKVPRAALDTLVKGMLISTGKTNGLSLRVMQDKLVAYTETPDAGAASDSVAVETEGAAPASHWTLNGSYLRDALEAAVAALVDPTLSEVTFELAADPSQAGMLVTAGTTFRAVIMPQTGVPWPAKLPT